MSISKLHLLKIISQLAFDLNIGPEMKNFSWIRRHTKRLHFFGPINVRKEYFHLFSLLVSNHSPSPYLKQEKKTSSLCPLPLNTADSTAELHEESLSTACACQVQLIHFSYVYCLAVQQRCSKRQYVLCMQELSFPRT